VITVSELLTWAMRAKAPPERLKGVRDLVKGSTVLEVTLPVAEKFGEIRASLLDRGLTIGPMDLLNAATRLGSRRYTRHAQCQGLRQHSRTDDGRLGSSLILANIKTSVFVCELRRSLATRKKVRQLQAMLSGWLSTRGALFSKRPTDLDRPKVHYGEMECECGENQQSGIRNEDSAIRNQTPGFPDS
jgi:hypothetical protein